MVAAGKTRKEEGGQWSRRTLGTRKEHPVVVTATSVPGQQGFLTLMQAFFLFHILYTSDTPSFLMHDRSLVVGFTPVKQTCRQQQQTTHAHPPPKSTPFS